MDEAESVDEISSKTWDVMENKMIKAGLREGIGAGREQVFQPSFDEGYMNGFKIGYSKGFLRAFLSVLSAEKPNEVDRVTDLSSPPPCNLCVESPDKFDELPISEIVESLREKDQSYVNSLKEEHSTWMRKLGIDFSKAPPLPNE